MVKFFYSAYKNFLISAFILITIFHATMANGELNIFPENGMEKKILIDNYKINTHYHDGSNPAIIFIHGFGGNLEGWKEIQKKLPNKSISLDLIGFGKSDRPDITYSLEVQSMFVSKIMNKYNIKEAVIVGRSMGASIAAWMAANYSEKTLSVILIAPSGYPGTLSYPWPYSWLYKPGYVNKLAQIFVDNPLYRSLFPSSNIYQALDVTNSYNETFIFALENIKKPTLLAWSEGDTVTPYEYHILYMNKIPNAKLVVLPKNVGHSVVKNYSDGIADIINNFVNN